MPEHDKELTGKRDEPTNSLTFVVPLRIAFSFGPVDHSGPLLSAAPAPDVRSGPAAIADAVRQAKLRIEEREGDVAAKGSEVLAVREGFAFRDGWITPDPAVVVVHQRPGSPTPADFGLPEALGAFPVEIRHADLWDWAEAREARETLETRAGLEGVRPISYVKPTDFGLKDVHEEMTVICHASPDAGWPVLSEFLQKTETGLTVGIYDFTAPHVIDGVLNAVRRAPRKLAIVMQRGQSLQGKPDDLKEDLTIQRCRNEIDARFDYAPASIGSNRQFASHYHIKVAVRDSQAFWLSSGNLQSSNQPNRGLAVGETSWDLLRDHNREWHVVIENAELARQFEAFLRYDLENAKRDVSRERAAAEPDPDREPFLLINEAPAEERATRGQPTYFPPLKVSRRVRVAPLLTPDNYQERVLGLIRSAERRILFQNQSLTLLDDGKNDPRFVELIDALLAKQQAGVDLRIMIRGEFAPIRPLERLQARGFDMTKVRLQDRCHTKGIIVDGARVLIGSHNWTNDGTLVNRDASLIFDDEEIARYYEEIFWFDWTKLSRRSLRPQRPQPAPAPAPDVRAMAAVEGEGEGDGQRLVSWREILYGD